MAAERQKPTQLGWRKPRWSWTVGAMVLGGPFNPLALMVVFYLVISHARAEQVGQAWLIIAGPALLASTATLLIWRDPKMGLPYIARWLALGVVGFAMALGLAAALTAQGDASLNERINLALAVLVLSLVGGLVVAASSAAMFRLIAMKQRTARSRSSRDHIVQPREIAVDQTSV